MSDAHNGEAAHPPHFTRICYRYAYEYVALARSSEDDTASTTSRAGRRLPRMPSHLPGIFECDVIWAHLTCISRKDLLVDNFACRRIFDVIYKDLCRICDNARVLRKVLRPFFFITECKLRRAAFRKCLRHQLLWHWTSHVIYEVVWIREHSLALVVCCGVGTKLAGPNCTEQRLHCNTRTNSERFHFTAVMLPGLSQCFRMLRCTQLKIALFELHLVAAPVERAPLCCKGALHALAKKRVFYGHLRPNFDRKRTPRDVVME